MSTIIETIKKEILNWPGVTYDTHRFGGFIYRLGKKEMGHIHGETLADLPFPMQIRDKLIETGRVSPHHILTHSGWVSKWVKDEVDAGEVIDLFKMQYERLKPLNG